MPIIGRSTPVESRVERPGAEIDGRRERTPPRVMKLAATGRRLTLISLRDSLPAKTRGVRGWGRPVPGCVKETGVCFTDGQMGRRHVAGGVLRGHRGAAAAGDKGMGM